jgi:hypothetical protein
MTSLFRWSGSAHGNSAAHGRATGERLISGLFV